jgi:thymidylate synthase
MMSHDFEYLKLLQDILDNGVKSDDRTGVGTLSVFVPRMMEFDLRQGFPLLTTKKMFFRGIIEELLWFLSGSDSLRDLLNKNIHIWDANAYSRYTTQTVNPVDPDTFIKRVNDDDDFNATFGSLNRVYGKQWRDWRSPQQVIRIKNKVFEETDAYVEGVIRPVSGVGYNSGGEPRDLKAYSLWSGMLSRVYSPTNARHKYYQDVKVCNRWHDYKNFEEDLKYLVGYSLWKENTSAYVLDKDYWGSKTYSKDTCVFISERDNSLYGKSKPFLVFHPEGGSSIELSIRSASLKYNLTYQCVQQCLKKSKSNIHKGYRFQYLEVDEGYSYRYSPESIDQISWVINEIRINPNSRRLCVNSWNPGEIKYMALPPCHVSFQLNVENGYLDLVGYQRSADLFLGLPFNIASYAALLTILATVTGLKPRFLKYQIGVAHIYNNHVEQVEEQLGRVPHNSPTLIVSKKDDINTFVFEDFILEGYQSHPAIKAPMAV